MSCRDCPYNESQLYEFADEEYIWCDKVGGKLIYSGYCCDANENNVSLKKNSNRRKRTKRERDEKYQHHLKLLYDVVGGFYPPAVYYKDTIWIKGYGDYDIPKPYYKRCYRSKYSSYLKRQSNKRIRRYKNELHKGYSCHKLFGFWWQYC